jgi:hypothetical protein
MPLDFGSLIADRAPGIADANPLAACAEGVTNNCRRRVEEMRKALDAAAARGLVDGVVAATETLVYAAAPTPPRKPSQIPSY